MKKKIAFVGMSGGVDSSVSAALLKQQGYDVIGVFIRTWHPDFLVCNEEEERRDAMRVAAHLDIPFLTFDFEEIYKKEVADYMIAEYKAGHTPNPDVMCNKYVKFGAFLKKALSMGADAVATGHYAQVKNLKNSRIFALKDKKRKGTHDALNLSNFSLKKGIDPSKDQSYFLWTLNQSQLSKILFPVGHMQKKEVRKLAQKFKLPVAEKKDSQGICFLGDIDLKLFLKHYIKEKKGKILNENGETIGYHDGALFHTLGERHGFTITKKTPNDSAYYIVDKDVKKNVLVVSSEKFYANDFRNFALGDKRQGTHVSQNCLHKIKNTNWIQEIPERDKKYTCQVRYHGEFLPCKIYIKNKSNAEVILEKSALVAKGQSIVIYDRDICLGGGVVI